MEQQGQGERRNMMPQMDTSHDRPTSLGRINQEPSQHQDIQSISECLTGHTPRRKDQTRIYEEEQDKETDITKMRKQQSAKMQ